MDELRRAVEEAILGSVQRPAGAGPDEVFAYALLVDGDLQTVFAARPSPGLLEEEGESVLLMPFDWDLESHSPSFERASELLAAAVKTLEGKGYEARARAVSDVLVSALERARERSSALQNTFLLVASAAGGDLWSQLEGGSVRRLNGQEAFERWRGSDPGVT